MPLDPGGRLRAGLWLLLLIGGLGGVLFMAGNLRSGILAGSSGSVTRENAGFLSMEPPQVYTRERLVNDRFREATWLNLQLDETTAALGRARQAQVSSSVARADKTVVTGSVLGATTTAPEAEAAPTGQTQLDELDLFRRQADYRERLRNDLMDTLLDDGHDLDGNTLYRLNFDAVALPWRDRWRDPGSAIFVVRMSSPFAEMTPASDDLTKRRRLRDDLALMRDWQRDMQVFLSKVLDLRVQAFNATGAVENPVDPKEDLAFDRYMRLEMIESFLRLAAKMGTTSACEPDEQPTGRELLALLEDGDLNAPETFCPVWAGSPGSRSGSDPVLGPRVYRAILRARMENVAIWTGFDWRRDAPSAEAPSAQVTEGLLRGLTAAQDVNRVRTTTSVEWYKLQADIADLSQRLSEMKKTQQQDNLPASRANALEAEMAQLEDLMQSTLRQQALMVRVVNDENHGRATIRVISALNALENALPLLGRLPNNDIGSLPPGTSRPAGLRQFLESFQYIQPSKADVANYQRELQANIPPPIQIQLRQQMRTGFVARILTGLPEEATAGMPEDVMAQLRNELMAGMPDQLLEEYSELRREEIAARILDRLSDDLTERLPDATRDRLMSELTDSIAENIVAQLSQELSARANAPPPPSQQSPSDGAPAGPAAAEETARVRSYLPQDRCLEHYWSAPRRDPMLYGQCMFLRSPAGEEVKDQLARFLLARLKGELEGYEGLEVPISKFVDIRLSGCAFGGCRIEVQQYPGLTAHSAGIADINLTKPSDDEAIVGSLMPAPQLSTRTGFPVARLRAADIPALLAELGLDEEARKADPDRSMSAAERNVQLCLDLAAFGERKGLVSEAGEAYHACMLRQWVEARRSDVAVYGVSPRILGTVEQALQASTTGVGLAGQTPDGSAGVSVGSSQNTAQARTQLQAGVIGFSQLPIVPGQHDGPPRTEHTAVFGWAVRPQEALDGAGWAPAHNRLSAVVAVPSWWRWLQFTVEACWISPARARELGNLESAPERICYGLPKSDWRPEDGTNPEKLREEKGKEVRPDLERTFEVQLPRRVDDITERFNFDFIKTPYWDSDWLYEVDVAPDLLSMEIGRPGRLVLAGERLWRGTVVTMNNQIADSIVVLPDMNGVIAEFNCVYAPPGFAGLIADPERLETWSRRPPPPIQVPVRVWTSEGRTQTRPVQLLPFVRRTPSDTPCDPANPGGATTDPKAWADFLPGSASATSSD